MHRPYFYFDRLVNSLHSLLYDRTIPFALDIDRYSLSPGTNGSICYTLLRLIILDSELLNNILGFLDKSINSPANIVFGCKFSSDRKSYTESAIKDCLCQKDIVSR